jgi:copper homeostasis protein
MNRRRALGCLLAGMGSAHPLLPGWGATPDRHALVELEVIASSLADAVAAHEGGAARLEVAVNLQHGGLTPPTAMMKQITRRVPIPARAMLRMNEGFVVKDRNELEGLIALAQALAPLGIEGFITGHIKDGKLDLETLARLVSAVPSAKFTIHNAIEMTKEPLEALRALRGFPTVDRALVTGGNGSLPQRAERVAEYEQTIGPGRLIVLGGLHLHDIPQLRASTDISIFHVGLAVRTPERPNGAVAVEKVREARWLLG